MINWLFSGLLFVLPFVFLPLTVNGFEFPKVIAAQIIIELIFVLAVFKSDTAGFKALIKKPQFLLCGVLFVLSLIHLLIFYDQVNIFGNIFRLQGIFLFWHLLILCLVSSVIGFKIVKAVPFACLILLTASIFLFGFDINNRAVGTLGEPNALAATAAFIFPFIFLGTKSKPVKFLSLFLTLAIIFLSHSRSGMIGLALELLLIVGVQNLKFSIKKVFVFCLLIILASLLLPSLESDKRFENRFEIWQTSLLSGLDSPLLGHGFGNIQQPLKQASVKLNNNIQYQTVDSSHNFLLDWWVQTGIIGLVAIILLIVLALKNMVKSDNLLYLALFLGLFTTLSFNPASVASLIAFWWLIGQGFKEHMYY